MADPKKPTPKMLKALQEAGGLISYERAAKLTLAWREENGDVVKIDKKTGKRKVKKGAKKPKYIKGFYLNRDGIDQILAQKECTGLRVYLGWEKGKLTIMVVGTRLNELGIPDDLVPPTFTKKSKKKDAAATPQQEQAEPLIANQTFDCPPICGDGNALNGGN